MLPDPATAARNSCLDIVFCAKWSQNLSPGVRRGIMSAASRASTMSLKMKVCLNGTRAVRKANAWPSRMRFPKRRDDTAQTPALGEAKLRSKIGRTEGTHLDLGDFSIKAGKLRSKVVMTVEVVRWKKDRYLCLEETSATSES